MWRFIFTAFLFYNFITTTKAQQAASSYFENIRNNEAALTAFFSQMPKGGDLHHHYSGSIYAEPLLQHAIDKDFFVDTITMQIEKQKTDGSNTIQFSALRKLGKLEMYQQKIIQRWSVKDFNPAHYPSHQHFFESFNKFDAAVDETIEQGMMEIKNRAIKENVSYIETMFQFIPSNINIVPVEKHNTTLRSLATERNEAAIILALDSLYNYFIQQDAAGYAQKFNTDVVEKLHAKLNIDDERFTMRYQNFVLRFMEPVSVFKNLVTAFISANTSKLVNGVNIVAPEHGSTALQDYWLHMVMYKYLHKRFPAVKYSLHAGELRLGLVLPEALNWHITAAVYVAGAARIGHGVDIAHEDSSYSLLRYMAQNKIAAEINLKSNEFILNVKDNEHPISLYRYFNVPIVISTDDAGILRSNMTEQYVLLAKRYPSFSYIDIKQIVFNSIQYSFIEDAAVKQKLLNNLTQRFKRFERMFPAN
jgi:adenosine deaminase